MIPRGIQHGTVTVLSGDHKIEVTTFRGEGPYFDGRRPSAVTFLGEIDGDLARRDFTVNAMAWDPIEGVLRDPFGGAQDLRRHRLRAVGDPLERFREDGLRPLRAVRFASTLRLALDSRTRRAIPQALDVFDKVAQERVRDELAKLLVRAAEPRPSTLALHGAARPDRAGTAGQRRLPAEPLPRLGRLAAHAARRGFRAAGSGGAALGAAP
jgi:tRNA nucleotidyltransferase (CCA-adding enzyme)